MPDPNPKLSIIIPAYNERNRIGGTLAQILDYLAEQSYPSEILVVDDGSQDETARVVEQQFPQVRLIRYPENKGKGFAVKTGMLATTGAYRLFYDADAATPISELAKVWPQIDTGADFVIGSRAMPESQTEVYQALYRRWMGKTYNLLLRSLRLTSFRDTQCGFKVMSAECTEAVFPLATRNSYGMDCEVLCIAERMGFSIVQIPIRWINSPDSKVHALFDSAVMAVEVLVVRFKLLTGAYPLGARRD